MVWPGALQTTGVLQVLEKHAGDVRPKTVYTHTFVLGTHSHADDRIDPFYTATGDSPEEAEKEAYAVYLRATTCAHHMVRKNPNLLECRFCKIQQRTSLRPQAQAQEKEKEKPKRRLFGWR